MNWTIKYLDLAATQIDVQTSHYSKIGILTKSFYSAFKTETMFFYPHLVELVDLLRVVNFVQELVSISPLRCENYTWKINQSKLRQENIFLSTRPDPYRLCKCIHHPLGPASLTIFLHIFYLSNIYPYGKNARNSTIL